MAINIPVAHAVAVGWSRLALPMTALTKGLTLLESVGNSGILSSVQKYKRASLLLQVLLRSLVTVAKTSYMTKS